MKVMWVCNQPNNIAINHTNKKSTIYGGWLSGLSQELSKCNDSVQLVYCYPRLGKKEQDDFIIDNVHYYSFYACK